MATQSLYRRYRPRRFAELKGQDHVVRALRTSVAEGREGQAYLFSGPRGTGKTTSARILAKVLNCESPAEGEPCCECASCLAVERGTSYDVHELDAASNNGVDAIRDLIEKASLGTPGRHKVYILDEVHMLSKAAEAALLKTLEEPPPHVVFVLATTDPQKMSDTIRSRTQHLQFHLLPADTLLEHVRWVAGDAGLEVTDAAIEQVLVQGAGSARDALSALELVANAGGAADEVIAVDDFVEAMIEHDPGRALTMAAQAISRGRDARTLTEELIGFLRNGFLSLMAPELVQLPSQRLGELSEQARRLGPAGLVRGIEVLGEALTEMRHAPDPRVLLDVAIVKLTSEEASADVAALERRLQKLERRVAEGVAAPAAPVTAAAQAAATAPPSDPATGRATLGGRARRAAGADGGAPASEPVAPAAGSTPEARSEDAPTSAGEVPTTAAGSDGPSGSGADDEPAAAPPGDGGEASVSNRTLTAADWDEIKAKLRGMARAVYAPATFVSAEPASVTLSLPNDAHRAKCAQHQPAVEAALTDHAGSDVAVELIVDGGGPGSGAAASPPSSSSEAPSSPGAVGGSGSASSSEAGSTEAATAPADPSSAGTDAQALESTAPPEAAHAAGSGAPSIEDRSAAVTALTAISGQRVAPAVTTGSAGRAIAEQARQSGPLVDEAPEVVQLVDQLPDDHEVDLDDLTDAPPENVKTPIDRLAEAFPGSELVDDVY